MKLNARIHRTLLGLVTLGLVLAACAPPAAQPVPEESTDVPTQPAATAVPVEPTQPPASTEAEALPEAAAAAQQWLADHLGVAVTDVTVTGQERAEWPNGCLGLATLGEACTDAIVPGWLVNLTVKDQTYAVRTDETGASVRLERAMVDSELSGTSWMLESFESADGVVAVTPPGSITLEFQRDGQAGGSAGCNGYGGRYTAEAGTLSFGEIASTLMLCADEGLMNQEQQYHEALQTANAYALTGEALTITHANGTLHFVPRSAEGHTPGEVGVEARLPGIVDFHADGSEGVLTAPDSVAVGEDFEITVSTFGGGCEALGDEAVVVGAAGADVLVYDLTSAVTPDVACTANLVRLTHTVTLRFDQAGERVLRVWGRRVGPETPALGVPTVLEHTITVQ